MKIKQFLTFSIKKIKLKSLQYYSKLFPSSFSVKINKKLKAGYWVSLAFMVVKTPF